MIAAGGVDVGSRSQPIPLQHRLPGRSDGNGHRHLGQTFLGAVHRDNFPVQPFPHPLGELGPPFRAAAIDLDPLNIPDGADGFQLAARLKAGADNPHAVGVLPGHPAGRQAGGRPGADLPQAAGFHAGKQGAAFVVVEHDYHPGAAGKGGIGFVAENRMAGIGGGHKVKEPAGHSDPGTGLDFHLPGAGVGKGFLQSLNALGHGQQLGNFLFVKKKGHHSSRVCSGLGGL